MTEKKILLKILLLGASKCGKTKLITRICQNTYNEPYVPTAGLRFFKHTLYQQELCVSLQLWDIGNQPLQAIYYRGVQVLVCVDLSESFESQILILKRFLDQNNQYDSELPQVVLGLKQDIQVCED